METATQILIILVSATLTLFLIAAIVATVSAIRVLRSLKRVSEKAEAIAEKAEAVGSFFEQTTGKLALGKFIGNLLQSVSSHTTKDKEK